MITTQDIPENLIDTNQNYTTVKVSQELHKAIVAQLSGMVFHKEVDGEYFVKAGRKSIQYVMHVAYILALTKIEKLGVDVKNFKHKEFVIDCMGKGEDFEYIANKVAELEKNNA